MSAPGLVVAREDGLDVEAFIDLLQRSGLAARRPVADRPRMAAMAEKASLVVTAREDGRLVGIARSLTDFAYCCYVSDLAVDAARQRLGIGRRLLAETRRHLHPAARLFLISAPAAVSYYERLGLPRIGDAFDVPPGAV